jgi:hypothetical protein
MIFGMISDMCWTDDDSNGWTVDNNHRGNCKSMTWRFFRLGERVAEENEEWLMN